MNEFSYKLAHMQTAFNQTNMMKLVVGGRTMVQTQGKFFGPTHLLFTDWLGGTLVVFDLITALTGSGPVLDKYM